MTKTFITNLFIGLLAFAVFSGVAAVASAQEEDVTTNATSSLAEQSEPELPNGSAQKETRQEDIEAKREEQKEMLDERREAMASRTDAFSEKVEERKENMASQTQAIREQIQERKAVLSQRIRDRILALADNISRKMEAAINRLTQITVRFEARIAILETRGVDVGPAQAKLNIAKTYLAEASNILENEVNVHVDTTVGSDNPREAWQAGKTKFTEAKESIRNAHQALKDALSLLKTAVAEAELGRGVSEATSQEAEDSEDTETNAADTQTTN